MKIIEIKKMLEDNTEDLLLTKRQLKKLQNRLEKCADEVQKRMIEDRIINCKMEILEYQKEDYKLNGQIKNIELQEMREELDFQLENGMITQVDYNDKMDKLKTFSATQEVYTDVKIAECEQKEQKISSQRNDLDDTTKKGMQKFYQSAKKNKINKLAEFAKKRQELELSILRQKVSRGEISPEEYADKVEYEEATTNINLEEFAEMYDDLKSDIKAPILEEKQTIQMLSEIKKYKGKMVNYQGKKQNFDNVLLEYLAGRIADDQYGYQDLRKSVPLFQDLPDFGTDKIEDLQTHIKEKLSTLLLDDLESILKSGQKDIVIPTADGKSISYSIIGIKKLIREMSPVIDEQKKYEKEQQSKETVTVKQKQWQEPEEQIVNIDELLKQVDENTAKINSEKEFLESFTKNQAKEEQLKQAGLDINAISSINTRKKLESQIQITQLQKKNMQYSSFLRIGKAQNLEANLRSKLEKGEISQSEFDEKMQNIRIYKLYTNLDMEVQNANYEISELRLRAQSPDFKENLQEEIRKIREKITTTGILQKSTDLKNLKSDELDCVEEMLEGQNNIMLSSIQLTEKENITEQDIIQMASNVNKDRNQQKNEKNKENDFGEY